jgi:Thioesterase domain
VPKQILTERPKAVRLFKLKSEHRSPLVPISPTGTKPPLFFVPASRIPLDHESEDGQFFAYVKLFHLLGDDRPIYGLRTVGLGGRLNTYRSLEQMASDYAGFVQSVQPQGPYVLVADCGGGILAYEIGRQLSLSSQSVTLNFLDSPFPDHAVKNAIKSGTADRRYGTMRKGYLGYLHRLRNYFVAIYKNALLIMLRINGVNKLRYLRRKQEFLYNDKCVRLCDAERILLEDLVVEYSPQRSDAKIILLATGPALAAGKYLDFQKLGSGWETVAGGGFEIHPIPGNHGGYCTEFAETTAPLIIHAADGQPTEVASLDEALVS